MSIGKMSNIASLQHLPKTNSFIVSTIPETERSVEFVNDIKLNDFSEVETRETVKQIEIKQLEEKND